MRQKTFSLIVILLSFLTSNVFAQNDENPVGVNTALYAPVPPYMVCDSIVNLDSVLVDFNSVKELQGMLSGLDSLSNILINLHGIKNATGCAIDSMTRQERFYRNFLLDSVILTTLPNKVYTKLFALTVKQISTTNHSIVKLKAEKEYFIEQIKDAQDRYDAKISNARILYKDIITKEVLNKGVYCQDAGVYKNGIKLFLLTYYNQGRWYY